MEEIFDGNLYENRPLPRQSVGEYRERLRHAVPERDLENVPVDFDVRILFTAAEIAQHVSQGRRAIADLLLDLTELLENLGDAQVAVLLAFVATSMGKCEIGRGILPSRRQGHDMINVRLLDITVDLASADIASPVLGLPQFVGKLLILLRR